MPLQVEYLSGESGAVVNQLAGFYTFADGSGGTWKLVVATDGSLGAMPVTGGLSMTVILQDGLLNFWQVEVATDGSVGTIPSAGPATFPVPVLRDSLLNKWELTVDTLGIVGTIAI